SADELAVRYPDTDDRADRQPERHGHASSHSGDAVTDSGDPVTDANPVAGADSNADADAHVRAERLGRCGERRPRGIPQPDRRRHERDGDDRARRYRDLSAWRGDLDLSGVVREPDLRGRATARVPRDLAGSRERGPGHL